MTSSAEKSPTRFTVYQIAEKLGIPRSNLQQYLEKGYIEPSIEKAKGKGTRNYFSLDDIYRIRIFLRLSQIGFSQREAASFSQAVKSEVLGKKGHNWAMITYGQEKNKLIHTHEGSVLTALIKGNEVIGVINFLKIKQEMDDLFGE
jgi:DNA-binding transcriptional MerR regulator